MGDAARIAGERFEDQVRSVACAMFGLQPGDGGAEILHGQEIDSVCRTEDVTHLIECTTDRTLDKVQRDVTKLTAAKRHLERKGQTVKLWIVCRHEPTSQQREEASPNGVTLLTLERFAARLLDAPTYLEARASYQFGSSADPATGGGKLPDDEYVAMTIRDKHSPDLLSISDIADRLVQRQAVVLLGPFGAGKSLSVREVYRELKRRYYRETNSPVPVAINLRDHWGQSDPAEILHRHATRVGFPHAYQLVRALNAGRLCLLLDGFDEVAAPAWRLGRLETRQARREALTCVRNFVQQCRACPGVLVSGRDQYFEGEQELIAALGLPHDALLLEIAEFTEEQAKVYLRRRKITTVLPEWLPRKPLLLGYLAGTQLLDDILAALGAANPLRLSQVSMVVRPQVGRLSGSCQGRRPDRARQQPVAHRQRR